MMNVRRWGGLYGFVWWLFALICVLAVAVAALSTSLRASTRAAGVATCVNTGLANRQQSSVENTKATLASNQALVDFLSQVYALTTQPRTADPAEQQHRIQLYNNAFKTYLVGATDALAVQKRLLALQEGAPLGQC